MIVESAASTQDLLKGLAAQGAPEGTWVLARRQTQGRGRLGRTWVAPEGALMVSILLRPMLKPEAIGWIPLASAVAVRAYFHPELRIKWPNDLLLPARLGSRKVAGILAEAEISEGLVRSVRVGIGVNVQSAPDLLGAGALSELDSRFATASIEELTPELVDRVCHWTRLAAFDPERVREAWQDGAAWIGEEIAVQNHQGILLGLAQDGALRLQDKQGTVQTLRTGDVALVDFSEADTR